MIEWYLKPSYQRWCVEPVTRQLSRWRFWTPQRLTAMAFCSGLLCAILLYWGQPLWACVCLWLSGYLDTLDGHLARITQNISERGAVLDILADRAVECSVIMGLFSVSPATRGFAVIAMLISNLLCVTAFLVIGIFVKNSSEKSFHYSRGWMERAEAFVFYTLMILFPQYFYWFAWIYSALVLFTATQHTYRFLYDKQAIKS